MEYYCGGSAILIPDAERTLVHPRGDFEFFGATIGHFTRVDLHVWHVEIGNVLCSLENSSVQGY